MILLAIILLSSLVGFALTWYLTGGLNATAGNPVAAVLVAIAIALLWSRGFMALERAYLIGRFDRVRRKLLLWGASLGVEEVALLRLFMAVEGREQEEIERCLATARPLGLPIFTKAWVYGATARLQGDPDKAVAAFVAGAEAAKGIDRAELLCEAGVALLQGRTGLPIDIRYDDLQRAINYANEVGQILGSTKPTREEANRFRYVSVHHRMLRAMIYLAQGRTADARKRLSDAASAARLLPSLRARRLAVLCRIEALPTLRAVEGEDAYQKEIASIRKATTLPLLRLRLSEIEEQVMRPPVRRAGANPADILLGTPVEAPGQELPEAIDEPAEVIESAGVLLGEAAEAQEDPGFLLGEAAAADDVALDSDDFLRPEDAPVAGPERADAVDGLTVAEEDDDDLIPPPADEDGQLFLEIPERS